MLLSVQCRMTTETVEQPRQEGGDHDESLKADTEQIAHTPLDDGNSATDSDNDDSANEADDQDAALQQAHSEVLRIYLLILCVLLCTKVILSTLQIFVYSQDQICHPL